MAFFISSPHSTSIFFYVRYFSMCVSARKVMEKSGINTISVTNIMVSWLGWFHFNLWKINLRLATTTQ